MRRFAPVLRSAMMAAALSGASAAESVVPGSQSVTEHTRAAAAKAAQAKQPTPEEILKAEHHKLLNDLLVSLSDHGDACDEAMSAIAKLDPKQHKFALDAIRATIGSLPDEMDGAKPAAVKAAKTEAALRIVTAVMRVQNGIPAEAAFKAPEKPSGK